MERSVKIFFAFVCHGKRNSASNGNILALLKGDLSPEDNPVMFGEILPSGLGRYVVKRNCWQGRDEGMDGQTTDNGHPMIKKAYLKPMAHVSLNVF